MLFKLFGRKGKEERFQECATMMAALDAALSWIEEGYAVRILDGNGVERYAQGWSDEPVTPSVAARPRKSWWKFW